MLRAVAYVMIAVTGAGCAQLVGIDKTNDDARGANATTVTRMSIGTTIETAPQDLTALEAVYFVANPDSTTGFDRVLAGDAGNGTWTADLPQPAPIQLTLPDLPTPIPRLFAFPNAELAVLYAVLEHPNRTPAPDPASIKLTVTLEAPLAATETFEILTVGSWSRRPIAAAELPAVGSQTIGELAYAFNTSASASGRAQLDRITAADAYLVLRHSSGVLTGVAEALPFDQTGDDTVTATMGNVAADRTLDVKLDPAQLAMRYAPVRPAVSGLAMNWSLVAAPGYRLAQGAGPVLRSGSILPTELGVTVTYGNPFAARGWNTMFALATSQSRTYTPVGTTTPVTLSAGMQQYLEPSAVDVATFPAGLPELISLDGKPLSIDGQDVARPTKFVDVTFISDVPSPTAPSATLYHLQVFDLLPNTAGNLLEYHVVWASASSDPKFAVPPEILQPGHRYTLRAITALGGYPALAAGDLVTRALPLAQSFLDSGVITVLP